MLTVNDDVKRKKSSFANGILEKVRRNKNMTKISWEIFEPYFLLGRVCGLSYTNIKSKRRRTLAIVHCCVTFLLILYCIGRGISFQKYQKFSSILVFKFLLLLYAVHCLVSFAMIILIQKSSIRKFVILWEAANQNETEIPEYSKLWLLTRFGLLYVIGCSVMNGLFVGFGSMGFIITFPFIESYFVAESLKPINGIIVFYTSIGFCMSQMLYCTICFVLLFEFWALKKRLFACDFDQLKMKLSYFRRKHFLLMKLTEQADNMLSYYAFAIYAFNLPTFIMTAFMLATETAMNTASKVTFALWVGVLLFQICIVSLVPSAVNYLVSRKICISVKMLN